MVFVSPPLGVGELEPKIVSYTPVVILPFFWNNGMKNWRYGGKKDRAREREKEKGRKRKGER